MRACSLWLTILAGLHAASAAASDGDPKRGAEVYRACVACHALEPDLHLSGPSLGNVLDRSAGSADGYGRYSPGLQDAAFAWNAVALDGWLKNPTEMIPGTYMAFPGIDDAQARADLIAFLEIAGAPGGGAPPLTSKASELDPFEQKVRAYLLDNPEVIMEALQVLQERQRAAEAENVERTIAERSEEILNDPAAPVGGNATGDVTLVEFFDYNCQYCRRVAPTVAELEQTDPDLRIVYKEFPILGSGSRFAARAALASREQGKYVPFHTALMQATEQATEESVIEIARAVGLDLEQLRADMQDPAIEEAIARNLQLANALGVTGTPSFVIGREIVPGAVDLGTLQRLIEHARRS